MSKGLLEAQESFRRSCDVAEAELRSITGGSGSGNSLAMKHLRQFDRELIYPKDSRECLVAQDAAR